MFLNTLNIGEWSVINWSKVANYSKWTEDGVETGSEITPLCKKNPCKWDWRNTIPKP